MIIMMMDKKKKKKKKKSSRRVQTSAKVKLWIMLYLAMLEWFSVSLRYTYLLCDGHCDVISNK